MQKKYKIKRLFWYFNFLKIIIFFKKKNSKWYSKYATERVNKLNWGIICPVFYERMVNGTCGRGKWGQWKDILASRT